MPATVPLTTFAEYSSPVVRDFGKTVWGAREVVPTGRKCAMHTTSDRPTTRAKGGRKRGRKREREREAQQAKHIFAAKCKVTREQTKKSWPHPRTQDQRWGTSTCNKQWTQSTIKQAQHVEVELWTRHTQQENSRKGELPYRERPHVKDKR